MNSYLTRSSHVARPRRRLKRPSGDPRLLLPSFVPPRVLLLGVLGFRRPGWQRLGVVCQPLWGHFAAVYPKEWQIYEMILISSPIVVANLSHHPSPPLEWPLLLSVQFYTILISAYCAQKTEEDETFEEPDARTGSRKSAIEKHQTNNTANRKQQSTSGGNKVSLWQAVKLQMSLGVWASFLDMGVPHDSQQEH